MQRDALKSIDNADGTISQINLIINSDDEYFIEQVRMKRNQDPVETKFFDI